MSPRPEPDAPETRRSILDAAEARFRRFGYTKTTMAEIADDAGMSAANLYRYFENKQDLAAACAGRCMNERIDRLLGVVRQSHGDAASRLRMFILETYEYTRERAEKEPIINELVDAVARERQDIVHAHARAQCGLIAEILAQGNESGEFDAQDVTATAEAVYASLLLFEVPIFQQLYTPEQFRRMARQVADLLLQGLMKR